MKLSNVLASNVVDIAIPFVIFSAALLSVKQTAPKANDSNTETLTYNLYFTLLLQYKF